MTSYNSVRIKALSCFFLGEKTPAAIKLDDVVIPSHKKLTRSVFQKIVESETFSLDFDSGVTPQIQKNILR